MGGTSKKLMKLVFERHLLYLMTYMLTTLVLVGSVSKLIGKAEGLLIAYLAMGTLLFLARVYEPFVFMNIKQDI